MSQCCKVPKTFGHFDLKQDSIAESQRKPHVSFLQPASILENDLSNNLNSNRLQLPINGAYSNFLNYNSYNALENMFHLDNGCQLGTEGYSNYDYEYSQKQKNQQQQQKYFNLLTTNFNSNLNAAEEVSNNLFGEQRKHNQINILETNSKQPMFKDEIPKEDKILSEIKKTEQIEIPCQKDAFSLEHMRLLSKKTLNNKELFQQIIPLLGILEEEPRYVNSRQYHRMMIMRIKRAKKATMLQKVQKDKQNQQQQQQQQFYNPTDQSQKNGSNSNNFDDSNYANSEAARTYKYESRHKHAMNRQRGPDGRFKSQNKQNFMMNRQSKRMKQNSQLQQNQGIQVKEEVK